MAAALNRQHTAHSQSNGRVIETEEIEREKGETESQRERGGECDRKHRETRD